MTSYCSTGFFSVDYEHINHRLLLNVPSSASSTTFVPMTEINVPKASNTFVQFQEALVIHLSTVLTTKHGLIKVTLPKDASAEKPTVTTYVSPDLHEKETILFLIMGKGESRAPAWVSWVCAHVGMRIGSMLPYVEKAMERGWGVVILNPNENSVITKVDADADVNHSNHSAQEQAGPAPPDLIAGIAEFGFSDIAAHRAAIGAKTIDLEDCGNWIFARMGMNNANSLFNDPLTEGEKRSRVVSIPHSSNAVEHTLHVWDTFLGEHAEEIPKAKCVHFGVTSYGGYSITKLLDARPEVRKMLGRIAMGDSSHFFDCENKVNEQETEILLKERCKNWVINNTGVPLGEDLNEVKLHVPSYSAGTNVHGEIPGRIVDEAFHWFDSFEL